MNKRQRNLLVVTVVLLIASYALFMSLYIVQTGATDPSLLEWVVWVPVVLCLSSAGWSGDRFGIFTFAFIAILMVADFHQNSDLWNLAISVPMLAASILSGAVFKRFLHVRKPARHSGHHSPLF